MRKDGDFTTFYCINHLHLIVGEVCNLEPICKIDWSLCHDFHAACKAVLESDHSEFADGEESAGSLGLPNVIHVGSQRLKPLELLHIRSRVICHLNVLVWPVCMVDSSATCLL